MFSPSVRFIPPARFFLSVLPFLAAACGGGGPSAERVAFDLERLEGGRLASGSPELTGKTLLIDIWGTWCPPCRAAIPHLIRLHERFADRGLAVLGAAYEHGSPASIRRTLRKFVDKEGVPYPILLGNGDPEADFRGLTGFGGFPTLILVAPDGRVVRIETGFDESAMEELEAEIESLTGGPAE